MPTPAPAGPKVFFPNFVLRLVRAPLPPHQAVFRAPPRLNKLDIQTFLERVYGLSGISDVRTMLYAGKTFRDRLLSRTLKRPAYKKVIVTMRDDFVFPDPPARDEARYLPPVRMMEGKRIPRREVARLRAARDARTPASQEGSAAGTTKV